MRSDELREILVARRDDDVDAVRRGLQRERADHVVGLDAVDAQTAESRARRRAAASARPARRGRPASARDAPCTRRRDRRGMSARRVDDERDVVGLRLELEPQHVEDAEQRAGRLAEAIGQWRQRVERAVEIAGAVDQNESRARHAEKPARRAGRGAWGSRLRFAIVARLPRRQKITPGIRADAAFLHAHFTGILLFLRITSGERSVP